MRLRTRLFTWFLVAILVAAASSSIAVALTRPEPAATPGPIMARGVAGRLARMWDDARACDAYVETMREATGFDFRLRRDPDRLPRVVQRAVRPIGIIAFEPDEGAFIPISRGGVVVGAVQFDAEGGGHASQWWWRLAVALGAGGLALAFAAERVARQIARPLERVSAAASRFGEGDLTARAALGGAEGHSGRAPRPAQDEVAKLASSFDEMADRVERVVQGQRELLGAVSHELRSPLGRARVALEIARDRAAADVTPVLDDVERQLLDVDAILGDLLAVTRAGLTDLRREELNLLPWLRARLAHATADGPIELVVEPEDAKLRASIDAPLMARVVHNLLANARVHGHPVAEPLVVHVSVAGGASTPSVPAWARVSVRDRGQGIAADLLPTKLFDAFVRADSARSRPVAPTASTGTGLGLALVRRIVEAHGGRVWARNVLPTLAGERTSKGAEVGFELPLL